MMATTSSPVDCGYQWDNSDWSPACATGDGCDPVTQTRSARVAMQAANDGTACPADETRLCQYLACSQNCVAEVTLTPAMTCRWETMNFVSKTRNCVSKTRNFVLKMMNSAAAPAPAGSR